MLSAMLGAGTQFLVLTACLLILGGMGLYYPYSRGAMKTSIVVIYAITSSAFSSSFSNPLITQIVISGWTSASFYKQTGGANWVWNIVLTAVLLPGPLSIVWSFLNTVAWSYHSTQALPFGTIVALAVIWSLGTTAFFRVLFFFPHSCFCPSGFPAHSDRWHHRQETRRGL